MRHEQTNARAMQQNSNIQVFDDQQYIRHHKPKDVVKIACKT